MIETGGEGYDGVDVDYQEEFLSKVTALSSTGNGVSRRGLPRVA